MSEQLCILHAAGAVDGSGFSCSPGSILIRQASKAFPQVEILAVGRESEVMAHPASDSIPRLRHIHAPESVLIPGLVNAHTHLDLTRIGPQRYDPAKGFPGWAEMIQKHRPKSPEEIQSSVESGIQHSLNGGVVAVGDIAGVYGVEACRALRNGPLWGISAIEMFGVGGHQEASIKKVDGLLELCGAEMESGLGRIRCSLQPHAPYSAGLRLYTACAERCKRLAIPMMTHLAETPQEREYVEFGTGAQVDFLERLGLLDEECLQEVGRGRTPVEHLREVLRTARCVAAHLNDVSDSDLEILCDASVTVAYCPRASSYFGQEVHFGPHRYQEMLAAGINVALGTDSVVNLPIEESDRLSTLDEARLLVRRDGIDPVVALGMATWRGGVALGLDEGGFSLGASRLPKMMYGLSLVSVGSQSKRQAGGRPIDWVMASEQPPSLVRLSD